jgi:hypothetical protein
MWWRFVHEAPEDPHPATGTPSPRHRPLRRPPAAPRPGGDPAEGEDEEMAAYNDYLAELAASDKAKRGAEQGSGGRARTSNIRLQRPTFCRLNYPGPLPPPSRRAGAS